MTDDYNPSEEYPHEENIGVHNSTPLTVKPEHIKLLRNMNVGWNDAMAGAPEISPKRPYGNSNHLEDIREITEMPNAKPEWCKKIHRETEAILQYYLANNGELSPGDQIIYKNYNWVEYDE